MNREEARRRRAEAHRVKLAREAELDVAAPPHEAGQSEEPADGRQWLGLADLAAAGLGVPESKQDRASRGAPGRARPMTEAAAADAAASGMLADRKQRIGFRVKSAATRVRPHLLPQQLQPAGDEQAPAEAGADPDQAATLAGASSCPLPPAGKVDARHSRWLSLVAHKIDETVAARAEADAAAAPAAARAAAPAPSNGGRRRKRRWEPAESAIEASGGGEATRPAAFAPSLPGPPPAAESAAERGRARDEPTRGMRPDRADNVHSVVRGRGGAHAFARAVEGARAVASASSLVERERQLRERALQLQLMHRMGARDRD